MTTRAEWQQLAEDRILDAQANLDPAVARWSAAFYLVGYAVECGLKACVMARVTAHPEVIYQDRNFSQRAWVHDFEVLLAAAGIKGDRDADTAASALLYRNWQLVKEWRETCRYQRKTQNDAEALYEAVTNPTDGVMQWITRRW